MSLKRAFNAEMNNVYDRASEVGVYFKRLKGMIARRTGYETAKILVNKPDFSKGFLKLAFVKKLDLSIETLVLRKKYSKLFDKETKRRARMKLEEVKLVKFQY